MNILVVTGSPRIKGNSYQLADAFTEGAQEAGNEVHRIDTGHAKISGCSACEYCFKHDGACNIEDDMQGFYEELRWADAVVYSFPLYYYSYPAQIKAFMDRQFCQVGGRPFGTKKTALLVPFEDKDIATADGLVKSFEIAMKYCNIEVVGIVLQNNCYEKGAIAQTDALDRARELGRQFK